MDKAFGYWLAGLIDGEGTFLIMPRRSYEELDEAWQTVLADE